MTDSCEIIRKLASVRKISAIEAIEGADRIVCAVIDGWKVVTQKSNNFKPGDLVVYFEIDSFLPVTEKFEFLRKCCFKSTKHLGDGFRIRTMKLRGVVSQGLILPMKEFGFQFIDGNWCHADNEVCDPIDEGTDLTEFLGVKKYEKPIPSQLAGEVKGNFPTFIRKTDQERVQNILNDVLNNYDQEILWETTLKLDGSSMTVYLYQDEFGVCSRNMDLKENNDNTFWKTAKRHELEETLRKIGRNIAVQGELMGPGVQGNRENLPDHEFFIFDIWDIDEQRYLNPKERREIYFTEFNRIPHVPVIDFVSLADFSTIEDFLKYANRKSIINDIAEGVVFKSSCGNISFKVINNEFLLKEV